MKYGYYINLDERGSFVADVRDEAGNTVFEVRAGDQLGEDECSIFEDGYMRDKHDLSGLQEYLRSIKVIGVSDTIVSMEEFEAV